MKTTIIIITAVACLGLNACQKKETPVTEDVKDKVGDALNTRPHENLRDAAEDLEKDAKDAGKDTGEALKELGNDIKKEIHDATK